MAIQHINLLGAILTFTATQYVYIFPTETMLHFKNNKYCLR